MAAAFWLLLNNEEVIVDTCTNISLLRLEPTMDKFFETQSNILLYWNIQYSIYLPTAIWNNGFTRVRKIAKNEISVIVSVCLSVICMK